MFYYSAFDKMFYDWGVRLLNMYTEKKYMKKFLKIMGLIVCVVLSMEAVAYGIYAKCFAEPVYNPMFQGKTLEDLNKVPEAEPISKTEEKKTVIDDLTTAPPRTNFLIVGLDNDETRTDTIMVGSFDSIENKVNLLSIPRDTYVRLQGDMLKKCRNQNSNFPSVLKINSITAYGGEKEGIKLLSAEIEELLGIKIDYYVKVNIDAFKNVVDTVGGIDFNVQQRLYYSDPTQNLYIDLRPGMQHLNGDKAEQLVRFRKGYAQQDLQRMQVQQDFFKAFVQQVLNKDTIKENFTGLAKEFIKNVDTDFGLTDIPKYVKAIGEFDTGNITTGSLPGYSDSIDGISYFMCDKQETYDIVQEFFFGAEPETESAEQITE